MNTKRLRLPKVPKPEDIEAAIRVRRREIAELKEWLQLAGVQDIRRAIESRPGDKGADHAQ